ncbi:MAG: hypothetical protein AAGF77_05875 [Bacteroidota bacterium]
MTIEAAKHIIGTIIQWQVYFMGSGPCPQEHLKTSLSLQQLFEANEVVKEWHRFRRTIADPIAKEERYIMPLEDRLLAAIYVLLEYDPYHFPCCVVNGKGLFCWYPFEQPVKAADNGV